MFPFNFTAMLDIILQFIFSYLILTTHFYKLQKCSLYLNVVILIIIIVFDAIDIAKFKLYETPIFLFFPFHLSFYTFVYVFGKKIIKDGYISIYLIIIMNGIIKFIINIVFSVIILIFERELFKAFNIYFRNPFHILLIIGKIISNFFTVLFT